LYVKEADSSRESLQWGRESILR